MKTIRIVCTILLLCVAACSAKKADDSKEGACVRQHCHQFSSACGGCR